VSSAIEVVPSVHSKAASMRASETGWPCGSSTTPPIRSPLRSGSSLSTTPSRRSPACSSKGSVEVQAWPSARPQRRITPGAAWSIVNVPSTQLAITVVAIGPSSV
jgi:hypothetical protein